MRRLLLASFALVPLTVVARLLGLDPAFQFGLAVLALAPLAWLISEATDQAAQHTGPAIGGLLNATFANVPELMIALFALSDGLFDVVRGSLTGSVVGNPLLVLGLVLAVGGDGELDRESARRSLALLALAVPLLAVAALPNFVSGDSDRADAFATFPIAVALLAAYGYVRVRSPPGETRRGGRARRAALDVPALPHPARHGNARDGRCLGDRYRLDPLVRRHRASVRVLRRGGDHRRGGKRRRARSGGRRGGAGRAEARRRHRPRVVGAGGRTRHSRRRAAFLADRAVPACVQRGRARRALRSGRHRRPASASRPLDADPRARARGAYFAAGAAFLLQ